MNAGTNLVGQLAAVAIMQFESTLEDVCPWSSLHGVCVSCTPVRVYPGFHDVLVCLHKGAKAEAEKQLVKGSRYKVHGQEEQSILYHWSDYLTLMSQDGCWAGEHAISMQGGECVHG